MELLEKIGIYVYVYCTDFVINLANLLGLSYYEINTLFFIIIWPVITLGLILVYFVQVLRLKKKRSRLNKADKLSNYRGAKRRSVLETTDT